MTRSLKRALLLGLSIMAMLLFTGLGVWQVERRAWKLALIEAVNERVRVAPVPAPPPAKWGTINGFRDVYRHVRVTGRFLHDRETLVQALTEEGAGSWVLTPMLTNEGFVVVFNRGFVPAELAAQANRRQGLVPGRVTITGLLRLSEPKGSFLQSNDPRANRWFSRDIEAIARARGLAHVAPYFVDADATPVPGGWPRGGLTVVSFPNNHLVYSLTWFGLAMLSLVGSIIVWRSGRNSAV